MTIIDLGILKVDLDRISGQRSSKNNGLYDISDLKGIAKHIGVKIKSSMTKSDLALALRFALEEKFCANVKSDTKSTFNEKKSENKYGGMTVKQLREEATNRKIKGRSGLRKTELIFLLEEQDKKDQSLKEGLNLYDSTSMRIGTPRIVYSRLASDKSKPEKQSGKLFVVEE